MTTDHSGFTRFNFELPTIQHKKLKALAAIKGVSLKDLILECVQENLLSYNEPNEETIKVIRETEKGLNLIHYKSVDELIDKFGL